MKTTMQVPNITALLIGTAIIRALGNKNEEVQNITSQHWLIPRSARSRSSAQCCPISAQLGTNLSLNPGQGICT